MVAKFFAPTVSSLRTSCGIIIVHGRKRRRRLTIEYSLRCCSSKLFLIVAIILLLRLLLQAVCLAMIVIIANQFLLDLFVLQDTSQFLEELLRELRW